MKPLAALALLSAAALVSPFARQYALAEAEIKIPKSREDDARKIVSPEYWDEWTPELRRKMDADIEKYRKADAVINLGEPAAGGDVKVEQIKHDFIFGAHIFNFNQLGTPERNKKYRDLYGSLFNSATIGFYWSDFETQPGRPRFAEEYWDTEEWWNNCKNPQEQRHWRRPATDPVVEFCNKKGIRAHGHPLVWTGFFSWWIYLEEIPKEKLELYRKINLPKKKNPKLKPFWDLAQEDAEKMFADVGEKIAELSERRAMQIARRYGDRVQSWDVVNEAQKDYIRGVLIPGTKVARSHIGLMQGDYAFHAFNIAQKYFPTGAVLNINDYICGEKYAEQIKGLQKRGARIDVAGVQEHVFNYPEPKKIMSGEKFISPGDLRKRLDAAAKTGLKIHVSEVTITGDDDSPESRARQALYAENQYRLWFSHPNAMGITWWNVVDGCGMRGEPSYSGIFTRDMRPKPAFYALDNLINKEWKTNLTVKPDAGGKISFRGFRGTYKISWKDKYGRDRQMLYHLK